MNYTEIKQLQVDQTTLSVPFLITKRREQKGYISINDLVAIKVENIASYYDRSIDLPIKRPDGVEIGYLYFIKDLEVTNIHILPEPKYVCFLIDISNRITFDSGAPHKITSDYLVVYRAYLNEYIDDYFHCAPIWGQFNHSYPTVTVMPPLSKPITEIKTVSLPKFTKEKLFEASIRGIKQSLPFERFLKYYHLLELNFDSDVIERIQKLNIDTDSESISILLNEYKREDIERLKYLFQTYCRNTTGIIEKMKSLSGFLPIAKKIFYDFGKESNPLKDHLKFSAVVVKVDSFNLVNCKAEKINNASNAVDHEKFIRNLCAYWIYRVRNSIAHNKIGEYRMTQSDESFIIDFAEPLLLELLSQIYK